MNQKLNTSATKAPESFELSAETLGGYASVLSEALSKLSVSNTEAQCLKTVVAAIGMPPTVTHGMLFVDEKRFSNLAKVLAKEIHDSFSAGLSHKEARALLGRMLGWNSEHLIAAKVKGVVAGTDTQAWLVLSKPKASGTAPGEYVVLYGQDFGKVVGIGRTEEDAKRNALQTEGLLDASFEALVATSHVTLTSELRDGDIELQWAMSGLVSYAVSSNTDVFGHAVLRGVHPAGMSVELAEELLARFKKTKVFKSMGNEFLASMFGTPDEHFNLDGTDAFVFPMLHRDGSVLPMTWDKFEQSAMAEDVDGFTNWHLTLLEDDLEGFDSISDLLDGEDVLLLPGDEGNDRWSLHEVMKRLLGSKARVDKNWAVKLAKAKGLEDELIQMLAQRIEKQLSENCQPFDVVKLLKSRA